MADSLKKRYLAKLSSNLVGVAIVIVTQTIIPRGLGPRAYGDFNFLSNFFTQVVGFLDMGSSIGFYTKLSRRQSEYGLVSFYLLFSSAISIFLLLLVGVGHVAGYASLVWPGQKPTYIYMAAIWALLTWTVQILNKMADAYGITVSAELARIMQRILGLIIISVLFVLNQLNLTNFFLYHYVILLSLGVAFVYLLEKHERHLFTGCHLNFEQIKSYIKEFYDYSHPLFVYSLVGLIVGIFERWMLQYFSGSEEQGFYGLSYQIGAICFLFTSAMSPLIMREFSIAYGKNDLAEMARLFRRYLPMLYAIAAYFACFVAVEADKVTFIVGGEKFHKAALAVTIMALYPIHQTYGQLSGAVFYATGQTALYRNIGVTFMLLGLPITYLLVAPIEHFGLNAGATGLAIKMVVVQMIGVNVDLFFNARLLGLKFWRYVVHQFMTVGLFLGVAIIAMFVVDRGLEVRDQVFLSFFVAGVLYTIMVGVLLYCYPILFGLSHQDIRKMRKKLHGILLGWR